MIEQGIDVNKIDIYGQNAIYYCINTGQLETAKLMKAYGAEHDHVDENG